MVVTIGIAVILLCCLAGSITGGPIAIESTDDAYTDGRAVAIAPRVSGAVVSLDVTDNQFVKKGQPLIHIDPQAISDRPRAGRRLAGDARKHQYAGQQYGAEIGRKNFPAQLEQAQAQLANANANLIKAQADYDRQRSLSKEATTRQDVDAAHGGAETGAGAGDARDSAGHAELARAAADRRDRGSRSAS